MSGNDYAALYASVQKSLSANAYGRNGRHAFSACPTCRIHVCITHHDCKGSKS